MANYQFSQAERYAVFTVHRERCWLCDEPVSLSDMEIDHIIPDSLEGTRELDRIFEAFNLPEEFTLQSYENWLPAHRRCNRKKRALVFKPTPIIQAHLELAAKSAPKARELEERYGSDRRIDRAVQELCVAYEKGDLNEKHWQKLIAIVGPFHEQSREPEERGKPILIAPGLEIISDDGLHLMLRGPTGMIGGRPKGENLHPSWDCPNCGVTGWNGTRCVRCGQMDDGD